MNDQVIASDLLLGAKSAVRNYAMALTESVSPDVRGVLKKQLDSAITAHENITTYMMNKGYYHAYNVEEQVQQDVANANRTVGMVDPSL
ncbi:MAG TPA: spore coat protein [Massilibacterium sp.]|nr:spore coat protein [Massilibacterium sp.]